MLSKYSRLRFSKVVGTETPMKAGVSVANEPSAMTEDLRLVVDTTPALIHTGRPDGYLDYFNRGWLIFVGKSLEEMCGWRWTNVVHPDDVAKIVEKWRAALASGEPFEDEARVRRADGEYRLMLHRKVPLRNERGDIVKWFGSSIDIEDRKRAEERIAQTTRNLQRSEFYLQEGERVAFMGSWSLRPDGVFEYWSPGTFVNFGFDPSKGIPTLAEVFNVVHTDDRELNRGAVSRMTREAVGCDIRYRIVHPERGIRFVHSVAEPVVEEGKLVRFVGNTLDVTEQERLNQELRRREAYLAQGEALSHTGSLGWDPSSGKVFWSDETCELLGYDHTVSPSLDLVLRRVHPDDVDLVREVISDASKKEKGFDFEHRLLLPNGSIKYVHVVGRPFQGESGSIEFVGSVMDVTEQHKAFAEIKSLKDELYKENIVLRDEIDQTSMFEEVIGASPVLKAVLARAAKVAPTDCTILIEGETGTGKELIARAIYKRSKRSGRAFVSVNCAAIPASLVMPELFGHEKGAFTGATKRRLGRFELAEGGTLFLDEVADLPLEAQIALLRVLQEREFERIGGTEVIRSDVRLVAATNRDLQAAMIAGSFRNDLYYRLNVFPINLPPLRERREDIPLLVSYFIDRYARRAGKKIERIRKKALEVLQEYSWPGNVRELQNVIERSLIISETAEFSIDESWLANEPQPPSPAVADETLTERRRIEAALAQSKGKISGASGAAALLGMPASTLESKIRSLRINKFHFKEV